MAGSLRARGPCGALLLDRKHMSTRYIGMIRVRCRTMIPKFATAESATIEPTTYTRATAT
jgi:hypothetical protein